MTLTRTGRRRWTATLAAAILLAACTGGDAEPDSEPTAPPPSPTATADPTTPEDPSPEPTGSALGPEWSVDTDGNLVPDFIEEELGYDPAVDDCAADIDCPGPGGVQALDLLEREQNLLLILDASGSMAGSAGGGQTKMEAAREALERYVTGTPDLFNIGFMVYGHRGSNQEADRPESCAGVDTLADVGEVDFETFPDVLQSFEPTGWTPVAGSLEAAREVFADRGEDANRVILVSDGIETCDGDPVAAAEALAAEGIDVTVDVVGFGVDAADEDQLRAIAEATGGDYTTAQSGDDLRGYFDKQRERHSALLSQFFCVIGQMNDVFSCYLSLSVTAHQRMSELAREADSEEERRAIIEIRNAASNRVRDQRTAAREVGLELRDEIQEQLEDARDRYRERFGESISYVHCPALMA
ncbi:MAG: VWA domain-containing protein [Nitriliruptorales bacterium]|nr:VWA domain-containing protein [Nitriliruptorales bacterium]